jgi:hypothetical protein
LISLAARQEVDSCIEGTAIPTTAMADLDRGAHLLLLQLFIFTDTSSALALSREEKGKYGK